MADGRIVLAGAGLAAVRTAQALREGGCAREIVMLSDEPRPPYDRPPLSKSFLLGAASEQDIRLLADAQVAALKVDMRLCACVAGLDRERRAVLLQGGATLPYGTLVVATGARPVRLPALAAITNSHVLRSLADATGLRAALQHARNVVVVGAGLIGLEVAAVVAARGVRVSVIEAASVPLAPVLGAALGDLVRNWHDTKGVTIHCNTTIVGSGDGAVILSDGSSLDADLVLIAVGTVANTDWLAGSGLDLRRGLVVDAMGQTDDPHVFGVGDAISRMVAGNLQPSRQWTLATEMARRVAKAIMGQTNQPALVEDNYFWSDQHGMRLQFAGALMPVGTLDFVAGGPDEAKFVAVVREDGILKSVLSVGMPREFLRHSMALRSG